MFTLPDFDLFRIDLHEIRYVEGFGRAFSFSPDQWTDTTGTPTRS
jgi:hypothetical protein